MLLLTLALIVGQDGGAPPPAPRLPPGVVQMQRVWPDGSVTTVRSERCDALLRRVERSAGSGAATPSGLMTTLRQDGQRVRMYHLLDRRIDGCPVPVVAVDRLPEADRAIGRTLPPR